MRALLRKPQPIARVRPARSGTPLPWQAAGDSSPFQSGRCDDWRAREVRILPEKTRIAFQVRMSFAQVTPRANWLEGHVVLARRLESPRFRRIETFSPRNHLHAFRLTDLSEVDAEFRDWLVAAYAVGKPAHLQ